MADINIHTSGDMINAGWINNQDPAINETHLNEIERAIVRALSSTSDFESMKSDLKTLVDESGDIGSAVELTETLSTTSLADLVVDGKIDVEKLAELLSKFSYDYSGAQSTVSIDEQVIATRDWTVENFGQYLLNGGPRDLTVNSTLQMVDNTYALIPEAGLACAKIIISLSGVASDVNALEIFIDKDDSSNTIVFSPSNLHFFNQDNFLSVVIELKQATATPGYIDCTISGFNDYGYNYRSIRYTLPNTQMNMIQIKSIKSSSDNNVTPNNIMVLYGTPAAGSIITYSDLENTPADEFI